VGSTYYAFTTGTALGNHIQALIDTSGSPASGWGSYTGLPTARRPCPRTGWETVNTQTSPGVFFYDGRWVMYYDATTAPYAAGTGHNCLSVATAASLTPTPVFTDTSGGPLECQASLGGSIDPSPFIDPATGTAYLVWKSNDGGSAQAARIWSAPLSQNGLSLAAAPTELLYNDTVDDPWESTVENPQLSLVNGSYALLFSGGLYTAPATHRRWPSAPDRSDRVRSRLGLFSPPTAPLPGREEARSSRTRPGAGGSGTPPGARAAPRTPAEARAGCSWPRSAFRPPAG